ncbi:MAG TPA: molybdopterin-dependent oxidoreductase [Actinomycetales bacterium]|nr:molybdopterin-dependent oxidoreductase [Actinomycetales bacterium]
MLVTMDGVRAPRSGQVRAGLAGVVACALTIAIAELLAALLVRTGRAGGTPAPLLAVGNAFVDRTPRWLKDWAVASFGTHDKDALFVGMALVLVLAAVGVGLLGWVRRRLGLAALVLLLALGLAAVLGRPHAGLADALPLLLAGALGLAVLSTLLERDAQAASTGQEVDRRAFLRLTTMTAAAAVVGAGLSSVVGRGARAVAASRAMLRLPMATASYDASTASLDVPGITPFLTPPDDFFRIDTALVVPQVSTADWRLRVHGLVDHPFELTFDQLLALPMVETLLTLTCVSNEVGGDLVGNQRWLGHPLRDLLARAAPHPGADMVLSTSADGWTAGTPLDALTDPGRDALLAVGMGGGPLPVEHGFPARLVVPGLYGYVSATKWVVDLEVTRFDRAEGYWTPRGWSARGPIKTESRIDVPRPGDTVRAGTVVVAGVAWAQHRGVREVEVRVDEGPWQPASLGPGGDEDTWRQWVWQWQATRGAHTIQVRATDGTGAVQTSTEAPPAPNGASGWHTRYLTVQ